MYVPKLNAVADEDEVRAMVAACRSAWLVTVDESGMPVASFLPIMWEESTVIAHMARANPQWRGIRPGAPVLLIVTGPEAYVSPSWYPSKREHGKAVPTWNYTAVHLSGAATVHEERAWVLDAVTALTEVHEAGRSDRWHVSDAPDAYIESELRAIVGIEVALTRVDAKAKLSQNRPEADQLGVIAALDHEPFPRAQEVADAMRRLRERSS